MTVIGTNTASLRAANASNSANMSLQSSMERLSTGKRINSGKDDAAGLAIASSMTSQIRGMNQGIRNANDGISMAQTADGALGEVSNMLQRMREVAVQSLNGTYSADDKKNVKAEMDQLSTQITSVLANTAFNGQKLFDGTAGTTGTVKIQAGATSSDSIDLSLDKLTDNADITGVAGATASAVDVTGTTFAAADLDKFDKAIAAVATTRANLGAAQNRLQSAVNNLTNNATNLTDAKSRIEDADFSSETANLAKAQILSQASTAMLAQANQSQQGVLKLLQ